jgi:hypothetical protein
MATVTMKDGTIQMVPWEELEDFIARHKDEIQEQPSKRRRDPIRTAQASLSSTK